MAFPWVMLAILVATTVLSYLLRPKPKFTDVVPQELDFPQAREGIPVPWVFGLMRLQAPNVLGFWKPLDGDIATPVEDEVPTGKYFDRTKLIVVAYAYRLGLHLMWCENSGGNTDVLQLYFGEGPSAIAVGTDPIETTVVDIPLWGGPKEGGSIKGTITTYNGLFDQPPDDYLEDQLGAGQVPAYRGYVHSVFRDFEFGESPRIPPISALVYTYTTYLEDWVSEDFPDGGHSHFGLGTGDMNPAEVLFSLLLDTDTWTEDANIRWRRGKLPITKINTDSFAEASLVLETEVNSCSLAINSPEELEEAVKKLLLQMDAVLYEDPGTQQATLKLIRDDYEMGIPALHRQQPRDHPR